MARMAVGPRCAWRTPGLPNRISDAVVSIAAGVRRWYMALVMTVTY